MAMTLDSPAFQQNGHIPAKYTCEGEDVATTCLGGCPQP
jgi:phosphatidylethanolamine-binding protein (PEBP) family uncharacterized protein